MSLHSTLSLPSIHRNKEKSTHNPSQQTVTHDLDESCRTVGGSMLALDVYA